MISPFLVEFAVFGDFGADGDAGAGQACEFCVVAVFVGDEDVGGQGDGVVAEDGQQDGSDSFPLAPAPWRNGRMWWVTAPVAA